MLRRHSAGEQGQALVTALATLSLATVMATVATSAYVRSTIAARLRAEEVRSLHLVEAAVQYALVQLGREGSRVTGTDLPLPRDLQGVTVRIDPETVDGLPTGRYVVTGTFSTTVHGHWPVRKAVRVVAVRPQDFSVLAERDIEFGSGALAISTLQTGADVHANGRLDLERIGLLGATTIQEPPDGRRPYVVESAGDGKQYVRGRNGRVVARPAHVPVISLPRVTADWFDALTKGPGFRIIDGDHILSTPEVMDQDTIVKGDLIVTRRCQWLPLPECSYGTLDIPRGQMVVVEGNVHVDAGARLVVDGLLYLPGRNRTASLVVNDATLTGSGTVAVRGDIDVRDLSLSYSADRGPALIVVSRNGSSGNVSVDVSSLLAGQHAGDLFIYAPVPSDGGSGGNITIQEGALLWQTMHVGGTVVAGGNVTLGSGALLASSLQITEAPDLWRQVPFLPPELDPGSTVQVLEWQEVE